MKSCRTVGGEGIPFHSGGGARYELQPLSIKSVSSISQSIPGYAYLQCANCMAVLLQHFPTFPGKGAQTHC